MLTAEDIRTRLRGEPFLPVRFVTTTGQTYDVYHPDLVLVGNRFIIVGLPAADSPAIADQVTRVSMIHITEMRDLARPTPSQPGNGATGS